MTILLHVADDIVEIMIIAFYQQIKTQSLRLNRGMSIPGMSTDMIVHGSVEKAIVPIRLSVPYRDTFSQLLVSM